MTSTKKKVPDPVTEKKTATDQQKKEHSDAGTRHEKLIRQKRHMTIQVKSIICVQLTIKKMTIE